MFYDTTAIDFLIDRIGWPAAMPPTDLIIDTQNTESQSGRFVDEFNKMAIVENVWFSIVNKDATLDTLNYELYRLKKDGVLSALSLIFDNNERAYYKMCNGVRKDISGIDYSGIIVTKGGLFDNAIGYAIACKTLELLITTNRANGTERGNKLNWETIKGELEGIKNEYGKNITTGLYSLRARAIGTIIDIMWPKTGRATLTARRVM